MFLAEVPRCRATATTTSETSIDVRLVVKF